MTIVGELFGYDKFDNDLLGYPQDIRMACLVCGVSANAHTPEMEKECLGKLFNPKESDD